MKLLVISALLVAVSGCQATRFSDTCTLPRERTDQLISLSLEQFDQDLKGGWRALADQQGCEARAASLIQAYINEHQKEIPAQNLSTLRWHQGQMWAAAGLSRRAVTAFKATKPEGDDAQNYYADATIAFLERDRKAFDLARASLAALPPPKNWDKAVADFQKRFNRPGPVWPMNLDVVDRLGACFDQPYSQAYAGACLTDTHPTALKP